MLALADSFGIDGAQLRGGRVLPGLLDLRHLQPDQGMACQLLRHEQGPVCGLICHLPEPIGHGEQFSVGVCQAVHGHETGALLPHVIGQAAHCLLRVSACGQHSFIRRHYGQLECQSAGCVRRILQHQGVVLFAPEPFATAPALVRARGGARMWRPSTAQEGLLQRALGRALNPRVNHNRVHSPELGEALQHVWSVDFEVFRQTVFRQPLDQRRVSLCGVFQGIRPPLLPAHAAVAALRIPNGALQGVHLVRAQMPVYGSDPVEVVPVHDDGGHVEAVERIKELLHPHVRPVKILGRKDDALALRPCRVERLVQVVPPLLDFRVVALEWARHVGAGLHLALWTPQIRGCSIEPLIAVAYSGYHKPVLGELRMKRGQCRLDAGRAHFVGPHVKDGHRLALLLQCCAVALVPGFVGGHDAMRIRDGGPLTPTLAFWAVPTVACVPPTLQFAPIRRCDR